jgi:hypothetical protein
MGTGWCCEGLSCRHACTMSAALPDSKRCLRNLVCSRVYLAFSSCVWFVGLGLLTAVSITDKITPCVERTWCVAFRTGGVLLRLNSSPDLLRLISVLNAELGKRMGECCRVGDIGCLNADYQWMPGTAGTLWTAGMVRIDACLAVPKVYRLHVVWF